MASERGLCELYADDSERADRLVFGRIADSGRRGFLKGAGLATMGGILGASIPFSHTMPAGLIPAALADSLEDFVIVGKDGLTVLNDRPVNAETPPHLLDDAVTPTARHFVRNNGIPPETVDAESWRLVVDGEVDNPLDMSIAELRQALPEVSVDLLIECGGNGRAAFNPPASGNQWTLGAVACSRWTGVRYADVLKLAQVRPGAVYTAHYGADAHLSGDPAKDAISRGVPMDKAMDAGNLIAFEMNGAQIHPMNGAPLRTVVPGWPGSCSQKWLQRIRVRDQVHDGAKMTGTSYRVPRYPVAPGTDVPKEDFVIIQRMPVKSLITFPATNSGVTGLASEVRGHAWSGDRKVSRLDVSIDFGASWMQAELDPPVNDHAWQNWRAPVAFPQAGYYEVWARATDDAGSQQPFAINWNPKGYLNNTMHRIAVTVAA